MRALIAARKSTKVEGGREGQSLHTQDEGAREFCERLGFEVVGVARDTISGRVAPVDRKELGAWLKTPERFDAVVAYRTDRLSRGDQEDWTRIEHWATERGKTLIIVDSGNGLRYPARGDSDYWQWQATKREAGREWDTIRERNIRSQAALVKSGSVTGPPAFGYRIVGERYAKRYEVVEHEAQIVREAFRRVTEGDSLTKVGAWLREATGRRWPESSVRRTIGCWTYAGRVERNGQHYADCPPILTPSEIAAAQKAMHSRNKKDRGGRWSPDGGALVVYVCGECGSKMYRKGRPPWQCYWCVGGHGFSVPCDKADQAVLATVLTSTEKIKEYRPVPGRNYRDEIEALKRDRLQAMSREDEDAVMAIWQKIKELEAEPVEPDRAELVETDREVGAEMRKLDRAALREALRAWTFYVRLGDDGRHKFRCVAPWADPETGARLMGNMTTVDRETALRDAERRRA
jgi:DNA invertase Pin-like site-specific DNA recombinase